MSPASPSTPASILENLRQGIRVVPDYPNPGIDFFDITTLLKNPEHLRSVVDGLVEISLNLEVDQVVGIEARGFFFAPSVAYRLGAGFVPVRKAGKLPAETRRESYELEYGLAEMEIHRDAVHFEGERFLIVDDVLATGGTAAAAARLIQGLGATVVGYTFLLEIEALNGRRDLPGEVHSLLGV